jgi:hypothetical protein
MNHISKEARAIQLSEDFIGKDAYRGVTLTYAFLANQFGHFALGFIPTILIYLMLSKLGFTVAEKRWPFIAVALFWIFFEAYNFYKSILKHPDVSIFKFKTKKFPFKPSWGNLVYDLITDLGYFCLGAFLAGAFFVFSLYQTLIYILPFTLLIMPSVYWFTTKMYLQQAQYPFQFRLSQWDTPVNEETKNAVLNFIDAEFSGTHLLIFGKNSVENIKLGVGIATEMSFKHNKCAYTTAMKLFDLFAKEMPQPVSVRPIPSWTWKNASFLIIDDISTGHTTNEAIITTQEFYTCINNTTFAERNKKILKEKKVIWVFGGDTTNENSKQNWAALLEKIGIDKTNIITVNLP